MKKFMHNIEFMRALAIVLVVFTHVPLDSLLLYSGDSSQVIAQILLALFQNGTVLFVFIAGFLFYFLNQNGFNYCEYLKKKIKFVILPYIIILTAVFFIKWFLGMKNFPVYNWSAQAHIVKSYFWSLLTGGYILGPLWFVPMITLFYLSAPFFRWLANSYWLFPVLILTLGISFFTQRPYLNLNPFFSYLHFGGIYILGVSIAKYDVFANKVLSSEYVILLLSFLFGGTVWLTLGQFKTLDVVFFELQLLRKVWQVDWATVQKTLLALLAYGISLRLYVGSHMWVKKIADYSFGIFFIHGIILAVLGKFALAIQLQLYVNSWSYIPYGLMVYALSHFVVYGVKKYAKAKSKYIIGC